MSDARIVFEHATLHASRQDAQHWLSRAQRDLAPAAMQGAFDLAEKAIGPYRDASRLHLFDATEALAELVPGIQAVALPGHSPGHTAHLLQSNGQRLLFLGDVVHLGPVQFPRPATGFRADVDVDEAARTRMRLLDAVSRSGDLVAGAHLPFPGIGYVRRELSGFRFEAKQAAPAR